jgi:hypothetical protein
MIGHIIDGQNDHVTQGNPALDHGAQGHGAQGHPALDHGAQGNPALDHGAQGHLALDHAINRALDEVSGKMSSNDWKVIEQQLSVHGKSVAMSLIRSAQNQIKSKPDTADDMVDTTVKRTMGEEFYLKIREKLVAIDIVRPADITLAVQPIKPSGKVPKPSSKLDKKHKGKKTTMTALEIRVKNTEDRIYRTATEIIGTFDPDHLTPTRGFLCEFIELTGITFVYMARFIARNHAEYQKEKNYNQVLGLMISMQRFIVKCSDYMGVDMANPNGARQLISQQCIADIKQCYQDIDQMFPFDGLVVCRRAPNLLVHSPLDDYVKQTSVRPRAHQYQIIQQLLQNYQSGCWILYNAMINTGKTTSIVGLAECAKHFGKKLLCVCNLDTVRIQMANQCYNTDTRFMMGSIDSMGVVRLTPHWSSSEATYTVIICGPEVAYSLLDPSRPDNPRTKYMLFHDEATIGAGFAGSAPLRANVRVMARAPKWTIFSSATAPTIHELAPVIDNIRQTFPDIVVSTVSDPTVYVGCEIRTIEGMLVVPYIGSRTANDLHKVIRKIGDIPFIGRTLTPVVALHLYKQLNINGVKGVPSIPERFRRVENMVQDRIRETVIEMLELLATQPEDMIARICGSLVDQDDTNDMVGSKVGAKADVKADVKADAKADAKADDRDNTNRIDYMALGTGEIFKGMTLIASEQPCEFALWYFAPLLRAIESVGIRSAQSVIAKYRSEMATWESNKEKMLKTVEVSASRCSSDSRGKERGSEGGRAGNGKPSVTAKSLKNGQLEQELDGQKPVVRFPEWAQIGTRAYCKQFIPIEMHPQVVDIRDPLCLHHIINHRDETKARNASGHAEMSVPDPYMLLLWCGVAIYAPSHKSVDPIYTSLVLDYATRGQLAYVVADSSITFGTNYPFGRVFLDSSFTQTQSIYTWFQTMGRAGRTGKLAKAEARVCAEAGQMLVDFAIHPERYDIEARNITTMLETIQHEAGTDIDMMLAMLERQMEQDMLDVVADMGDAGDAGDAGDLGQDQPDINPVCAEPFEVDTWEDLDD